MKIPNCRVQGASVQVCCSKCHSPRHRGHGKYTRKGFHIGKDKTAEPVSVPRFLCLNPDCPRRTFSILPPLVLRYSRFFWPCLLVLSQALAAGETPYHLARHVCHVGRGVILRAAVLLKHLGPWVEELHRELTEGRPARELALMVKIITAKLGRIELGERWYRHRYPLRFSTK
jgi:hypothetical protein